MALANSQIPALSDLNNRVNEYIGSIIGQISLWSAPQKINYWSSKISEHVHIFFDVLLPEFNQFTKIVMMRWLLIGFCLHKLCIIWKNNEGNMREKSQHKTLTEWLPYIVKRKLSPNLFSFGSYSQLRKYIRMWENKEIIIALPELRNEYTHRIEVMNRWLRQFHEKVRIIAVQRDIEIPQDIKQQIELYTIHMAYHSTEIQSDDDENDTSVILDPIMQNEQQNCQNMQEDSSDTNDDNDQDEKKEQDEKEKEKKAPKLSQKDLQILRYREKISGLRKELSETKRLLKTTQMAHCHAARERHVYRELHNQHQHEMDELSNKIMKQHEKLNKLKESNITLNASLIEAKQCLHVIKNKYMQFKDNTNSISPSISSISSSCYEYNNKCGNKNRNTIELKKRLKQSKRNRISNGLYSDSHKSYSNSSINSNLMDKIKTKRGSVSKLKRYIQTLKKENIVLKAKCGKCGKCKIHE